MAVVDIATFVADLKDLAADHGFHVHDERHFVETYSMRQAWEVDLHPAHACGAFAVRRGQQRLQFGGLSKQGLLPSQVGGMGRSSVPGPGAGSGPGRQCR